jgi:hypothetical protein
LINKYIDRAEFQQSANFKKLKTNYLSRNDRLQNYFVIYNISTEDIKNGFMLHSEIVGIIGQLDELENEMKLIEIELTSPDINEIKESELLQKQTTIRKKMRDLKQRREEIKKNSDEEEKTILRKDEDFNQTTTINEYGIGETEQVLLEEEIYKRVEGVISNQDENFIKGDLIEICENVVLNPQKNNSIISNSFLKLKKKFLYQFNSSYQSVRDIAEIIFDILIKTGYICSDGQISFCSTYIKIYNPPDSNGDYFDWKFLIQKQTMSQLNFYLNIKTNPILDVYNKWDLANYANNLLKKIIFRNEKEILEFNTFFVKIIKEIKNGSL